MILFNESYYLKKFKKFEIKLNLTDKNMINGFCLPSYI
jgi:hypothetical protein